MGGGEICLENEGERSLISQCVVAKKLKRTVAIFIR